MELRMYGLVPYNLSPIQQGIQFGHSVVEYGLKYNNDIYRDWATNHKTFIILNGGTTNNNPDKLGTLNSYLDKLFSNQIDLSYFTEPDLGDQLTAITFIVDERVFNKELYPDYDGPYNNNDKLTPIQYNYQLWSKQFGDNKEDNDKIIFLRELLDPRKVKMA